MAAILSAELAAQLVLENGTAIEPAELINRKRSNMLIHSYLYYWCDDPVWNDDTWQKVADELTALQEIFPIETGFYDDAFKDWSGATGSHLPKDDWVRETATRISRAYKSENIMYNRVVGKCE